MNGLSQRIITGLIFATIVVIAIVVGPYSFGVLFAIVTLLCLWEFYNIVLLRDQRRDLVRRLLAMGMGMVPYVLAAAYQLDWFVDRETFIAYSSLLFFPFIFIAFVYELYTKSEQPFVNVAFIVLGTIYIGIPFALLFFAAFPGQVYQPAIVIGLLVMNWMNDSGAYFFGSKFGKTPLFPRISPKKTWEGGAGGLLGAATGAVAICYTTEIFELHNWITLAVIVVIFGDLGDLVESMLKRSFSIKDSGNLLPGHGGFLDRFDAFIFLLPFATAYILLFC